jgi:hypothetical protein
MVGSCEWGYDPAVSVKCGDFLSGFSSASCCVELHGRVFKHT